MGFTNINLGILVMLQPHHITMDLGILISFTLGFDMHYSSPSFIMIV